jgi:predicted NBD/HSP70 family sugar kinase
VPLQLGRDKFVIGIHVGHRDGKLNSLFGVLTRLNEQEVASDSLDLDLGDGRDVHEILVVGIEQLVKRLMNKGIAAGAAQEKLLGVGVEIGAHVNGGEIILAANARALDRLPLRHRLTELLTCPVTVENDLNARAIQAYYDNRLHHLDFALVEVFDGGTGGAHILDGRLYRGSGGLAPEPGHLTVEYRPRPTSPFGKPDHDDDEHPDFSRACTCGSHNGHVDSFATTCRIRGELNIKEMADLEDAANAPALVEDSSNTELIRLSKEGAVFRRAGTALGRGLAAIINIVNPGDLILRLPSVLAAADPQTSGAQYLSAVENAVNEAFSTGPRDARNGKQRLTIEAVDENQVPRDGAFAAATTVLNGFIEHANERDGCKIEHRRSRVRNREETAA